MSSEDDRAFSIISCYSYRVPLLNEVLTFYKGLSCTGLLKLLLVKYLRGERICFVTPVRGCRLSVPVCIYQERFCTV